MMKLKIPLTVLVLLFTFYPMYSLFTQHDPEFSGGLALLSFFFLSILAPFTGFLWGKSSRKSKS